MVDTVTVADRDGNEFEAEAGVDPTRPVSPDNPPAKAIVAAPQGPVFERHDSNSPSAEESKKLAEAAEKAIDEGRVGELRPSETREGVDDDTTTGPDNGATTTQSKTKSDDKAESKKSESKKSESKS